MARVEESADSAASAQKKPKHMMLNDSLRLYIADVPTADLGNPEGMKSALQKPRMLGGGQMVSKLFWHTLMLLLSDATEIELEQNIYIKFTSPSKDWTFAWGNCYRNGRLRLVHCPNRHHLEVTASQK